MDGYQTMRNINKNMIKMGVIKMGFIVSKYVATKTTCFVFW
jgi:hypothetical protein